MPSQTEARAISGSGFLIQGLKQRGQHSVGRNITHPYFHRLPEHIFIAQGRKLLIQGRAATQQKVTQPQEFPAGKHE